MNDAPVLDRLLDDASQFPPGNLALEAAWDAHRRWRKSEHARAVGRFLVPSARAAALAELIFRDGADGIELGIVVGTNQPDELSKLLEGPAQIGSVELRGGRDELERWREHAPEAAIFLEGIPVEAVAQIRGQDPRAGAKLRCGGLEAGAFPSSGAVASFIEACVRLDVPFKATAGLHQPLRHWDAEIGAFHHGFLNLLAATALAARGAPPGQLVGSLEIEGPDAWRELAISTAELKTARRWFRAFGTCSIEEPLEGLAAIGLLDG
jgi:hypothetical protein